MFELVQVESWIVIYDFGDMGLTEMPMCAIKAITSKISLNFSGRLKNYSWLMLPVDVARWITVSAFLDPETVQKIKTSKTNTENSLFQIADPSQIQQEYRGNQPDRTFGLQKYLLEFKMSRGLSATKNINKCLSKGDQKKGNQPKI